MAERKHVLIVSSDLTLASVLDRALGSPFEIHSASTDIAAFALLDSYAYACVVVDMTPRSVAGPATISSLRIGSLTVPVIALVSPGSETSLPEHIISCTTEPDVVMKLALAIRDLTS